MKKQELIKEALRRMKILGVDEESQNLFKRERRIFIPATSKLTKEQLALLEERVKDYNNDEYMVYGALPVETEQIENFALLIATTNKGNYISENKIILYGGLIKTYIINLRENEEAKLKYVKLRKDNKGQIIGIE